MLSYSKEANYHVVSFLVEKPMCKELRAAFVHLSERSCNLSPTAHKEPNPVNKQEANRMLAVDPSIVQPQYEQACFYLEGSPVRDPEVRRPSKAKFRFPIHRAVRE